MSTLDLSRPVLLRAAVGSTRSDAGSDPMRPPWSESEARFLAHCDRCARCIEHCPTQVLRVDPDGYPEVDFSADGCTGCGACARACASGAIDDCSGAHPFAWRITVDDRCLVEQRAGCRTCAEACETRALRFLATPRGARMLVDDLACTGCGACVAPCPVGAISMQQPARFA